MEKIKVLSFIFLLASCKQKSIDYCNMPFANDSIGFMIQGELFTKKPVTVSIVKVKDKTNWDHNEYFTGNVFSPNESEQLLVLEKDSCQLKKLYFRAVKIGLVP